MLQPTFAIQLASLRLPFKKALQTASRLGATAVEINARTELKPSELSGTGIRHIRKLLEDLNLRVAAIAFPTRRGYEVAADLQPRIEGTGAAMRMAFQLGADTVVNHIGQIPDLETEADAHQILSQSLFELDRLSQREGAALAALTADADPQQIRDLAQSLPEGLLQLAIDPGESIGFGIAPEKMVSQSRCPTRLAYFTDGVKDPSRGRGEEVAVGRGSVDFSALLAALEERGYDRHLLIRRRFSENPVMEISNAIEYLRALFV